MTQRDQVLRAADKLRALKHSAASPRREVGDFVFLGCADRGNMRTALRRITVLSWFLPGMLYAQEWTKLKPGMSRDEASAVIGRSLISSAGRGFEVSIYDHRAELVFHEGKLVTWTAPASSAAAVAPTDTWRFEQVRIVRALAAPIRNAAAPPMQRGLTLPASRL